MFSYLHLIKWGFRSRGIDVLKDQLIYLKWDLSPALHLLLGKRGPFLLQGIPWSNPQLWIVATLMVWGALIPFFYFSILRFCARTRPRPARLQ